MLVHFGTNPFGGFLEEFYTLWLPKGSHGPNDNFNSRRITNILINSRPSFPSSAFSRRLDVIFGLSPEMCAGRCHMRLRLGQAGSWMEQLGDIRGTALDHPMSPKKMAQIDENDSILVNQINLYLYIYIENYTRYIITCQCLWVRWLMIMVVYKPEMYINMSISW